MNIQPCGTVAEEASFERPLALLAARHERVSRQCSTLLSVVVGEFELCICPV